MRRKKVLVLDAFNCMYRGYFPNKYLENDRGRPTGAIHGVFMHVRKLRKSFPGTEIVFAWDGGQDSNGSRGWRFDQCPTVYKAQRKKNEDHARVMSQIGPLRALLHYAGYLQFRVPGVEADDLIALLTRQRVERGEHVVIDSSDKDFFVLLSDNVTILQSQGGCLRERTPEHVYGEYGVDADDWTHYRALTGDPSDGLSGLTRCGPVKALVLLADGARANLPWQDQPGAVRSRTSEDHWANVMLCYQLSELPRDCNGQLQAKSCEIETVLVKHSDVQKNVDKFKRLADKYQLVEIMRDRTIFI